MVADMTLVIGIMVGCALGAAAAVIVLLTRRPPAPAEEVPADATAFDMRGAALSHREGGCSCETFLTRYALRDPALDEIGRIIHEADLADERSDAPEAAGLDTLIRGLSMNLDDEGVLEVTGRLFDGLYTFKQRAQMLGREPA